MAGSPHAALTDALRRQVRRCRWRWNLVAMQVVLFGTIAVAAAVGTVLLALALATGPLAFGTGLLGGALVVLLVEARLVRRLRRAWLGARAAPAWIDRAAGLDGRLTTLLARGDRPAFLVPLLHAQNEAMRRRWMPDQLVPTPFPLAALTAALLAGTVLFVALQVAPRWQPPPPEVVSAGGGDARAPVGGFGDLARRMLAALSVAPSEDGEPGVDTDGRTSGGGTRDGDALARASASLQARIRRQVWGERWARGARGGPSAATARRRGVAPRRGPTTAAAGADQAVAGDGADEGLAGEEQGPRMEGGGAATGAGAGTDPELFGAAAADDAGRGHFALALAARVHGSPGGLRPPSGAPVPPDVDRSPVLAARPRPDAPFHATTVPPAYARIVRHLFTHPPSGGSPP